MFKMDTDALFFFFFFLIFFFHSHRSQVIRRMNGEIILKRMATRKRTLIWPKID